MKLNYDLIDLEKMGISPDKSLSFDILEGLSSNPKYIPSKYHYDDTGSKIFQQITRLKEYYPTRCELENLKNFKKEFADLISSKPFRMIELGVGDAHKTKILLQHFLNEDLTFEYVPIDCCKEVVLQVITSLKEEFCDSSLKVLGITADYFNALSWLSQQSSMRNVVLFLGSNIGNFTPSEVQNFLYHLWNSLKDGDYILIGFDLKKDIDIMEKAYNDKQKVTEAFNLNLLDRINAELGSDFNRHKFKYHSFYNPREGGIESWLISTEEQIVKIPTIQKEFHFDAFEGIHVENSYKYSLKEIEHLAQTTGFSIKNKFVDNNGYFAEVVWEVKKMSGHIQGVEIEAINRTITSSISQD